MKNEAAPVDLHQPEITNLVSVGPPRNLMINLDSFLT